MRKNPNIRNASNYSAKPTNQTVFSYQVFQLYHSKDQKPQYPQRLASLLLQSESEFEKARTISLLMDWLEYYQLLPSHLKETYYPAVTVMLKKMAELYVLWEKGWTENNTAQSTTKNISQNTNQINSNNSKTNLKNNNQHLDTNTSDKKSTVNKKQEVKTIIAPTDDAARRSTDGFLVAILYEEFYWKWDYLTQQIKADLHLNLEKALLILWRVCFTFKETIQPERHKQLMEHILKHFEQSLLSTARQATPSGFRKKLIQVLSMLTLSNISNRIDQSRWINSIIALCKNQYPLSPAVLECYPLLKTLPEGLTFWRSSFECLLATIANKLHPVTGLDDPLSLEMFDALSHSLQCHQESQYIVRLRSPYVLQKIICRLPVEERDFAGSFGIFKSKKYCSIRRRLISIIFTPDSYTDSYMGPVFEFFNDPKGLVENPEKAALIKVLTENQFRISSKMVDKILNFFKIWKKVILWDIFDGNSYIWFRSNENYLSVFATVSYFPQKQPDVESGVMLFRIVGSAICCIQLTEVKMSLLSQGIAAIVAGYEVNLRINQVRQTIVTFYTKIFCSTYFNSTKLVADALENALKICPQSTKSIEVIKMLAVLAEKFPTELNEADNGRVQAIMNKIYIDVFERSIQPNEVKANMVLVTYLAKIDPRNLIFFDKLKMYRHLAPSALIELQGLAIVCHLGLVDKTEGCHYAEQLISIMNVDEIWEPRHAPIVAAAIFILLSGCPVEMAQNMIRKLDSVLTSRFEQLISQRQYLPVIGIAAAIFPACHSYSFLKQITSFVALKANLMNYMGQTYKLKSIVVGATLIARIILLEEYELQKVSFESNRNHNINKSAKGKDFVTKRTMAYEQTALPMLIYLYRGLDQMLTLTSDLTPELAYVVQHIYKFRPQISNCDRLQFYADSKCQMDIFKIITEKSIPNSKLTPVKQPACGTGDGQNNAGPEKKPKDLSIPSHLADQLLTIEGFTEAYLESLTNEFKLINGSWKLNLKCREKVNQPKQLIQEWF